MHESILKYSKALQHSPLIPNCDPVARLNFAPVMSGSYPSSLQETPNATTNDLNLFPPSSNPNDLIDISSADAGRWHHSTENQSMEESKPAPRRRRPSGNDHVKHRRTRNGCYTCRGRRVKVTYSPRTSQSPVSLILFHRLV